LHHVSEDEESRAYWAAAAALAGQACDHLAAGDELAAQALLDGSLRWPLPALWLLGLEGAEQAQLLCCAMRTHPPLAHLVGQVQRLSKTYSAV